MASGGSRPARTREDMGVVIEGAPSAKTDWPERFSSMRAAREFLAKQGYVNDTYFMESLVEYPDGWGFRFRYDHMFKSQQLQRGDWWHDWLASQCPALLLHGHKSWVMTTEHARAMAARRPNTRLVEFPHCGHTIHDEDPIGFYKAVEKFLNSL